MALPRINGFERHVILFAKDWYNKVLDRKNSIDSLKILLSKYANISVDHISDDQIYKLVVSTFCKYNTRYDQEEVLDRLFDYFWNKNGNMVSRETVTENMLKMIAVIVIKDVYDLDTTLLEV